MNVNQSTLTQALSPTSIDSSPMGKSWNRDAPNSVKKKRKWKLKAWLSSPWPTRSWQLKGKRGRSKLMMKRWCSSTKSCKELLKRTSNITWKFWSKRLISKRWTCQLDSQPLIVWLLTRSRESRRVKNQVTLMSMSRMSLNSMAKAWLVVALILVRVKSTNLHWTTSLRLVQQKRSIRCLLRMDSQSTTLRVRGCQIQLRSSK